MYNLQTSQLEQKHIAPCQVDSTDVTFRGFGPSQQRTITFNGNIYSSIPGYGEHLPSRGINTNGYPNHTKHHTQRFNTCGEHLLSRGINTDVHVYLYHTITVQ